MHRMKIFESYLIQYQVHISMIDKAKQIAVLQARLHARDLWVRVLTVNQFLASDFHQSHLHTFSKCAGSQLVPCTC